MPPKEAMDNPSQGRCTQSEDEMQCDMDADETDHHGQFRSASNGQHAGQSKTTEEAALVMGTGGVDNCAQVSRKDRHLHLAARYSGPDSLFDPACEAVALEGVGAETVRILVFEGANPLVKLSRSLHGGTHSNASDVAGEACATLQSHIDRLLSGSLCQHYALSCYMHASKYEEAAKVAEFLLLELAQLEESKAFLKAAAQVWTFAAPTLGTVCSEHQLCGRGVLLADTDAVHAAVACIPRAGQAGICPKAVKALADSMWKVALQSRETEAGHKMQDLCCSRAERDAMHMEEKLAECVRLLAKPCTSCARCSPEVMFPNQKRDLA